MDAIALVLQIFLIIVAMAIVLHKSKFTIIILIAVFSLLAATLYMMNQAPDVAIAEVAINAAIIPLIYVISISRQHEFIVLDKIRHGFIDPNEPLTGEIYQILLDFTETNNLKLNVCCDIEGSEEVLTRDLNVDLIIDKKIDDNLYILKGRSSNLLLKRLKEKLVDNEKIKIVTLEDGDPLD
jgi:putative multicomponent Na+:H+ antiporter subunit B